MVNWDKTLAIWYNVRHPDFFTCIPNFFTPSPVFLTCIPNFFIPSPIFLTCIPNFFTPSPMEENPRKARRKLIDRKVGRRLECVLKLFACSNLPLFLVGCQSYIGQDNLPLAQHTLDCDQEVINRLATLFPTDQEHSQSALSRAQKKIRNQLLTEEEWEDCWFYIQKRLFGKKMNNNNPVPPFSQRGSTNTHDTENVEAPSASNFTTQAWQRQATNATNTAAAPPFAGGQWASNNTATQAWQRHATNATNTAAAPSFAGGQWASNNTATQAWQRHATNTNGTKYKTGKITCV